MLKQRYIFRVDGNIITLYTRIVAAAFSLQIKEASYKSCQIFIENYNA